MDLVAQGEPVASSARNLGISEARLRRWISQSEIDRGDRERLMATERREWVELRRRNRVLETEIEVFRRASAYFVRENVLPKWGSGSSTSSPPMD